MFQNISDRTKATIFYALAFTFSAAVVLLAPVLGAGVTAIAMLTPLLAVLLMLLIVTRDGYTKAGWAALGLHRAGIHTWGLALLVPFLILGFGYGVLWLTGIANFAMPAAGGPLIQPLSLVLQIVLTLLLVFGEEVGWRGYLLPHLSALGRRRAVLLSGLLHGIWHLPILLLTPYYHNTGNPLLVVPLFLASLTMTGVFYGELRLRTGSVWPAAIAHTAGNSFSTIFTTLTITTSPLVLEYLVGESGLLTLLGLAVLAGWILYRLDRVPRLDELQTAPRVEANA
jgi:membrane protease YdiL (CAAX protease family)